MKDIRKFDAQRRSEAIALARVICIAGVVYVHAWTGLSGHDLLLVQGTPQENLRWVFMEIFGHSAVPLLGLISGWLVAGSRRTLDWRQHIGRKARTILLPMVLWNALALLLVSGTAAIFHLPVPTPQSVWWVIEEIFIVTHNPDIDVQMPFLRDLFLCMMLAPLLVRLPRRWLWAVVLGAAVCHIAALGPPIILRPSILFFFTLGILARRTGLAERIATMPWMWAALPFALLMPIQLCLSALMGTQDVSPGTLALDLATRIAAAAFYWRTAWAIAGQPWRDHLLRFEPYAFFYFCSHLIVIWLGGPILGALTGPLGSPLYPFYLLLQPMLVLAVVVPVADLLTRTAPLAAHILSGGRLEGGSSALRSGPLA